MTSKPQGSRSDPLFCTGIIGANHDISFMWVPKVRTQLLKLKQAVLLWPRSFPVPNLYLSIWDGVSLSCPGNLNSLYRPGRSCTWDSPASAFHVAIAIGLCHRTSKNLLNVLMHICYSTMEKKVAFIKAWTTEKTQVNHVSWNNFKGLGILLLQAAGFRLVSWLVLILKHHTLKTSCKDKWQRGSQHRETQ